MPQRALLLLSLAAAAAATFSLSDVEDPEQLDAFDFRAPTVPYKQPAWDRKDEGGSQLHALLERAARLHQEGKLDKAVSAYKAAIKQDAASGEAYAALGKCLYDQGKDELAEKAFAKATRLYNEQMAHWSLF